MAERTHRQRAGRPEDEAAPETAVAAGDTAEAQRRREELDDLLDEIDEVLESNAEEFVRSYVQKGGQ
jgi:ubiquitin-like protein Pup